MKNNPHAPLTGALAGLEPLSRRGFLRTTLIASMAFTSGCASLFGRKAAPEVVEYHSLSPEEVEVITRLTEVMLPTAEHGLPSSTDVVPTIKNLDAMAQRMPTQTRELLSLALWVFNNRPMASFKFKRFTSLTDEQALAYIDAMQQAAFFERGIMTTLKALVALNYWRDERTWPGLDYHGPVTETWGVRRLGNAPLPRA